VPTTHFHLSCTAAQVSPPPTFQPPYLGNHSTFSKLYCRIKFFDLESICEKVQCFDLCVFIPLHTPMLILLLLRSDYHQPFNHHNLRAIPLTNFILESNSLTLKRYMTNSIALVYVCFSFYTLLHLNHYTSTLITTNLSTNITCKPFNLPQSLFQNKILLCDQGHEGGTQ
jgi:hypothetical protein